MKIEVGMYVRLGRGQGFNRIINYDDYYDKYVLEDFIYDINDVSTKYLDPNDIIGNPSYNLMDLIKINDIVNYCQVTKVILDSKDNSKVQAIFLRDTIANKILFDDQILFAVTEDRYYLMAFERVTE